MRIRSGRGLRTWLLAALVAALGVFAWQVQPSKPVLMVGTREPGPRMDGWHAYDYRAGANIRPAVNMHNPAVPLPGGAVRVDDSMWSIDDPESPKSVLALMRYDEWTVRDGRLATTRNPGDDLRGSCVRFKLRGAVDLHGGHLTFWVMSPAVGQRWHTPLPLSAVTSGWQQVEIRPSEVNWRRSWSWNGPKAKPELDIALGAAGSYGIGIVGFGDEQEPAGWLEMRNFRVGC